MITRRDLVAGGLLTIAWIGATASCCAQTPRQRHSFGCMLADDEVDQYLAASATQSVASDAQRIVTHSDDREFDRALAETLDKLSTTFDVLPDFVYYNDFDGANALATTRGISRAHGTVLYGQRYLKQHLGLRVHPDVAVTAVCAHEFGHIVQYKLNLRPTLTAGQTTVKRLELHADFLAGYFSGIRKQQKPDYPAEVFASTKAAAGDNQVNHPNHHGRPEERSAAITRGFEAAYREKRNLSDAIQTGVNYVLSV